MQTLGIDENNNLILSQGNLRIKSGINALAQDVKTRIGLCKRENPFNKDEGIDFDNDMLGKMGGVEYYKQALRNRILDNDDGITNINQIQLTRKLNSIELTAEISSSYGVFTI